MTAPLNVVQLATGNVRLVCEYCGRRSGPRATSHLSDLPLAWSMAPYPADFVHSFDGSSGSLYACPTCNKNPIGRRPLLTRGHPDASSTAVS